MTRIFTVNARSNVYLEALVDYYGLKEKQTKNLIELKHRNLCEILRSKGVSYESLKSALVPNPKRIEAGFVFDTSKINSYWYGLDIFKRAIPLLNKNSTQSLLNGDLLGTESSEVVNLLQSSLVFVRPYRIPARADLFCLYLNNLSDNALRLLDEGFSSYAPYLGYLPCQYGSKAKTYLSHVLISNCIKHKSIILQSHAPDIPQEENLNSRGYPFEECGYQMLSLQDEEYDLFLTYKIERPILSVSDRDTLFSINTVSANVIPITDFEIFIEESKFLYATQHAQAKLKVAGITDLDKSRFIEILKTKIKSNYIYNLEFSPNHNVIKFNILIETNLARPTRFVVSFEYKPAERILRLITFY